MPVTQVRLCTFFEGTAAGSGRQLVCKIVKMPVTATSFKAHPPVPVADYFEKQRVKVPVTVTFV